LRHPHVPIVFAAVASAVLLGPSLSPSSARAAEVPPSADSLRVALESEARLGHAEAVLRMALERPQISRDAVRRRLDSYVEHDDSAELAVARFIAARHAEALGDSSSIRLVEWVAAMTPPERAFRRRAADALREAQEEYAAYGAARALAIYGEGARLSRAARDPFLEADALSGAGNASYALARYVEADSLYRSALALASSCGDEGLHAYVLRNIGIVRQARGEFAAADSSFRAALEEARALHDDMLATRALNDLGNAAQALGNFDDAESSYRAALAETRRLGLGKVEAQVLGNVAIVRHKQGDSKEALALYGEALDKATALGDRRQQAVSLANMGNLLEDVGDHSASLASLARALSIEEEMGERRRLSGILSGMGNAYRGIGDLDRAVELHRRALEVTRETGNRYGEGTALSQLANDFFEAGLLDSALASSRASLEVSRAIGSKEGMAGNLVDEGRALLAMRRHEDAERALAEGLAVASESGFRGMEAGARLGLGIAAAERGDEDAAAREFEEAGRLARLTAQVDLEAEVFRRWGAALAAAGRREEAIGKCREALALLESERGRIRGAEERTLFFEGKRKVYEETVFLLAEIAASGGSAGAAATREAFEISERAHARGLLDLLAQGQAPALAGISPEIRAQEERLTAALARAQRRLGAELSGREPDSAIVASYAARIDSVAEAFDALKERALGENPVALAQLGLASPRDLAEIQRRVVPDGGLVIEYLVGDEKSVGFAITRDEARLFAIPAGRADLAERVRAIRGPFERPASQGAQNASALPSEDAAAARALFVLLLGPVRERIGADARLVIIPDGPLHYLPFETLRVEREGDAPRYLVEDVVLSLAPSASVLVASRGRGAERPPHVLLALGNPRLSEALPIPASFARGGATRSLGPLPYAEEEARTVAALLGGDVAIGAEAAEARVKTDGPLYRILHFSTHGLLDEERPLYSGVLLAPDSLGRDDGFLQVREVLALPLHADLVTLSGCETGLGRLANGEGVIGLTRAFLAAGTRSVVVSLWAVADRSTARLMEAFYRGLRETRGDVALALARAKRTLLDEGRRAGDLRASPFAWSPFVLVGEDRIPWLWAVPSALALGALIVAISLAWTIAYRRKRRPRSRENASS